MDPKVQFVLFFLGALCFFMAAFFENHPPGMSTARYCAVGWCFFAIPFAWNAAVAGW